MSLFLNSISSRRLPVHSFLLIRNGKLLVDAHFFPYDGVSVHDVASVTKSVTSLLVGVAVQEGLIHSIDDPLSKYLSQYSSLVNGTDKGKITIRNLLTMTSGLKDTPLGNSPIPEALLLETMQQKDWGRFILSLPLEHAPGTQFNYNSAHYHLLSLVLRAATRMDPLVFAEQGLFAPLGIRSLQWPEDPQGNPHGWGDLKLLPVDMAKIGFLCLNNGVWEGTRILPRGWIDASFTSQIQGAEGYGYGWWVPSGAANGIFEAQGRGGQYILIWPRKNVVAVFTGGGFDVREIGGALMSILKLADPIPEDRHGNSLLHETVDSLTKDRDLETRSSLPKKAFEVSGTNWRFAPNLFGLQSLSLSFLSDEEAYAQIALGRLVSLRIGLNGKYAFNKSGREDLPTAVKGRWIGSGIFLLELNEISDINDFFFRISFGTGHPRFFISEKTLMGGATIELPLQQAELTRGQLEPGR